MKSLTFILHRLAETDAYENSSYKEVSVKKNNKFSKKYTQPSVELQEIAYAISENTDFKKFVSDMRSKHNLPPNGFDYGFFKDIYGRESKKENPLINLYYDVYYQLTKRKVVAHPLLAPHLANIVFGNFINVKTGLIDICLPSIEGEALTISVTAKVSFNKLIEYLRENRTLIESTLKKMPDGEFKVNKDYLEYAKSKKGADKYNDLMSKVEKKEDKNLNIEENSFGKGIRRAVKKTQALFSYKGQKL